MMCRIILFSQTVQFHCSIKTVNIEKDQLQQLLFALLFCVSGIKVTAFEAAIHSFKKLVFFSGM